MKPMTRLLVLAGAVLLALAIHSRGQPPAQTPEALTGFDDQSNGFSDPDRRKADQKIFDPTYSPWRS